MNRGAYGAGHISSMSPVPVSMVVVVGRSCGGTSRSVPLTLSTTSLHRNIFSVVLSHANKKQCHVEGEAALCLLLMDMVFIVDTMFISNY